MLPPLDPCPLPLTLAAAPLFHFPPNNRMTNRGCQKMIYDCPTAHPPLPYVPFSSLFASFLPSVPFTGHPFFSSLYFSDFNGFTFLSTWGTLSLCPCSSSFLLSSLAWSVIVLYIFIYIFILLFVCCIHMLFSQPCLCSFYC